MRGFLLRHLLLLLAYSVGAGGLCMAQERSLAELKSACDTAFRENRHAEALDLLTSLLNRLENATPATKRSVETSQETSQARHLQGLALQELGRHEEATQVLAQALRTMQQAAPQAPEVGALHHALGTVWQARQNWTEAESHFRLAMEHLQEATPKILSALALVQSLIVQGKLEACGTLLDTLDEPDMGPALVIYWQARMRYASATGDFALASTAADYALQAAAQVHGTQSLEHAVAATDLAGALLRFGKTEQARTGFTKALEQISRLPTTAIQQAAQRTCRANLGVLLLQQGDAAAAADQLALALPSTATGPLAAEALVCWNSLGCAQHLLGKTEIAQQTFQHALDLAEKHLPRPHALRAQIQINAAALAADLKNGAEQQRLAFSASRESAAWFRSSLAAGVDLRLLDLRLYLDPVSPLLAFGQADPGAVADTLLANKEQILTETLSQQRMRQLHTDRPPQEWPKRAEHTLTHTQLQQALPGEAVFLDFATYQAWLGAGKWERRYGVLILKKTGSPLWLDLNAASRIERLLLQLRQTAESTIRGEPTRLAFTRLLQALYGQLWPETLARQIPAQARLIIRPDALLHFVPWAVLQDPADAVTWFCQRYPRVEFVSLPEILAKNAPAQAQWRVEAITAAPSAPGTAPSQSMAAGDLSAELWEQIQLMKPLPGALKEAAEVRKVGFPTHQVLVRENVSEKEFFQMQPPPWLIHLACHGFALPMGEQDPPAEALYQSGLLLGNSSPQLRLLAQGKPVESNNDGILLTAEIAALNLQSTGLVVLSACQSGLGQPTPGESFQGLVKAFLAAGAQRVANSLWSVRDGLAPELMRQFYTNLSTLPPGQALWRMQQSWLQSGPGSPDERAANAGAWLLLARGWEP